jgi:hypothetical protein
VGSEWPSLRLSIRLPLSGDRVKWQEDRSEGFVSDNQGRDHSTRAELALDENGRFLGLRVSILANLGAYLSPFGCFVPTRSTDLVSGLYSMEAIHINVKGVCTNTVAVCAYRGAGRPEAAYLLERLVDAAARDDPLVRSRADCDRSEAAADLWPRPRVNDDVPRGQLVIADGKVVGRIFNASASPVGLPWMRTFYGYHQDRSTKRAATSRRARPRWRGWWRG